MLRLNEAIAYKYYYLHSYSNTTNVKVKLVNLFRVCRDNPNSNTTNVKVKHLMADGSIVTLTKFKYNQC